MIERPWLPLNALRAFEAVGRHGGFTAGAAALKVSQSAISRHVIRLEALLGTQLLERRPQGLALTEAGAALLPVVTRSFDRVQQALNDAAGERAAKPRSLRVHMAPSFAQLLAVPILRGFRWECPDILLDLSSASGLEPPRDVDAAVVYAKSSSGELVADLLWMVGVTPLCCPTLARAHAGLPLGEFLARNELLHVKVEGEPRHHRWQSFARACGLALDADRGLAFDTAVLAAEYARSGEGVALLDPRLFADDIAQGRLAAPYDRVVHNGYGYFVTVAPEDLGDPAIARFRSWLIGRFAAEATPAAAETQPHAVAPRRRSA